MPAIVLSRKADTDGAATPQQQESIGLLARITETVASTMARKRSFVTEVVERDSENRIKKLVTREQ